MVTLKCETFADFKIQRQSVFYFVIDVASVILSSMCIGFLRQCRRYNEIAYLHNNTLKAFTCSKLLCTQVIISQIEVYYLQNI